LIGSVRVRNGATLTIEPGTIVKGNAPNDVVANREKAGFLIITKTGAINAVGTCDCPIVMTTRDSGEQPDGTRNRARGDWGGLLLAGNGFVDNSTGTGMGELEGFLPEETPVEYGGDGSIIAPESQIDYLRVEFAGIDISGGGGNETNTVTMGALQASVYTKFDHVQASYGGDDSFEWFGGDVNHKWLYSFLTSDDDFDLDEGYSGKVQFAVAMRGNRFADSSGSNGIEGDGIISGGSCAHVNGPFTVAQFSNFTMIGSRDNPNKADQPLPWPGANTASFDNAIEAKEGLNFSLYNSLIGGWDQFLDVEDEPTADQLAIRQASVRKMFWRNNFNGPDTVGISGCGTHTLAAVYADVSTGNSITVAKGRGGAALRLGLPGVPPRVRCPDLIPRTQRTLTSTAGLDPFITLRNYRGAFAPETGVTTDNFQAGFEDIDKTDQGWCTDCVNNDPKWLEFNAEVVNYGPGV